MIMRGRDGCAEGDHLLPAQHYLDIQVAVVKFTLETRFLCRGGAGDEIEDGVIDKIMSSLCLLLQPVQRKFRLAQQPHQRSRQQGNVELLQIANDHG
ncbi:hypothetical protein D3C87_1830540 [compost metagenome]